MIPKIHFYSFEMSTDGNLFTKNIIIIHHQGIYSTPDLVGFLKDLHLSGLIATLMGFSTRHFGIYKSSFIILTLKGKFTHI